MSLVLEDTDDIIHQAEGEALEEWRSDNIDSFENNDGCQSAEWIECLLGSIKAFFHCWKAHRCDVRHHHCFVKVSELLRLLYMFIYVIFLCVDTLLSPLFCLFK